MEFWTVFLLVFFVPTHANFDAREHFCGKKLANTLEDLCMVFNEPASTRFSYRVKRQIVHECCYSPCTRRFLVEFYCHKPHSSVIKLINSPVREETTTEIASSTINQLDVGNESGTRRTHSIQRRKSSSSSSSSSSSAAARGKSNKQCKCRKRRTLKKLKRRKKIRAVPAPPPKIGRIEDSQVPFYVWKV